MNNLKAIDLFAGVGGVRLGFQQAFGDNIEFVFSSDIDKFARKTYFDNFSEEPYGDITKIDVKDIPSFDILLGGFPCQSFSIAGLRKGFDDTRGTLFFDVARIIDFHKPQVVFLENVKGLLSHNKGNTFKVIQETLEQLGYSVHFKILNAKDFGVPQNRERIYIVCLKNSINFEFPIAPKTSTRIGDILESEVECKYTMSDKLWTGHQKRRSNHQKKGNGFGYGLFKESSSYVSTISARYYKDGSEILIEQEDKNPRKLTPREAARLQGFPDDFKITVSDTQFYKQMGNSVAVPVIREIAKNIFKSLENF